MLGHRGEQQLFLQVWNDGFWWPDIRKDIKRLINNCEECQRVNVIREGYHPLKSIVAEFPWDHIAIDLKEMPVAMAGERYLFVIADIATDYVVLIPLVSKEKFTVARALWHTFAVFGVPVVIQSDNGLEFVNDVIKALNELHGIDHRVISPYHPRANGFVERKNFDLQQMFKKVLKGNLSDWVVWVPFVQMAYNSRISGRTGSSAYSLMFGRALRSFRNNDLVEKEFDVKKWQDYQQQMRKIVYPAILERVTEKKNQQAVRFNETHKIIEDILSCLCER
jgi:hypothetical protein